MSRFTGAGAHDTVQSGAVRIQWGIVWSLIRKTNLLNLINLLLVYIYCSTYLLNHRLIMFKNFLVKQF